jgi:DNA helicase-2/ATP-dependent DNA helicase PcrA
MMRLTEQQRDFIESPRPSFVRACPGAGKTAAIARRVLALSGTLPARKGMAILSFSNSAIDEIIEKCHELEIAKVLRHPSFVGTFDAFLRHFFIVLFGLPGVAVRVTVVNSWDTLGIGIRLGGEKPFRGGESVSLDNFDPVTNAINPDTIGHNGLRAHVQANREAYVRAAARWRRNLRNRGFVSAADVRAEVIARLRDRSWADGVARAISARFAELIVDEAQDCNSLDIELLQWLRDSGLAISVVADPDQAIYGFRQGNPADLAAFAAQYAAVDQREFTGNFRSNPAICKLAATLRARADPDQPLGEHRELPDGVHILIYDGQRPTANIHAYFNQLAETAGIPTAARMMLAHGRTAVRHACGLAPEDAGGTSRVSKVARAVAIFRTPTSTGRAREACLATIEEDILRLTGKFTDNSTVARCVEQERLDGRSLRRSALQVISRMPHVCEDTDAARAAWVETLRTAITLTEIPCVGTTPRQFYVPARSPDWSRCLQNPADVAPNRWTTIHDAKGSQHEAVCVVVPPDRGRDIFTTKLVASWKARDELESKRVVYVGVTRAQKLLAIAVPRAFCNQVADLLRVGDVPFEIHDLNVAGGPRTHPDPRLQK